MKSSLIARRGLLVATLAFFPVASAFAGSSAPSLVSATTADSTRITTVDPRVPRAAGRPCVVELFRNQPFLEDFFPSVQYTYAPPPDCPKPWSKVVLAMDISGNRDSSTVRLSVTLADLPLFGGFSPKFDNGASWHVERDLTDDASFLSRPNNGLLVAYADDPFFPATPTTALIGSARLLFYRATARTPAPRVPDVVYPLASLYFPSRVLPHNIVRAYVEVFNQVPWWYTCVTDDARQRFPALLTTLSPGDEPKLGIFPPAQGCTGGSFVEAHIVIDGAPAGVAPLFPLLPVDFNPSLHNTVDQPVPPPQMLNLIPYRVDLTPFAGLLSGAGPHTVRIQSIGQAGYVFDGQLLLYLDPRTVQVTGGVTLNTLAGSANAPTVTDTLHATGNVLRGKILTRLDRNFEIRGFVNTSYGRIYSTVTQRGKFSNAQTFHVFGLGQADPPPIHRSYQQDLQLISTVNRSSRRTIGAEVISSDHERVAYPLRLHYHVEGNSIDSGDGFIIVPSQAAVTVHQERLMKGAHYRPAVGQYTTALYDVVSASRSRDVLSGAPDTNWNSFREYSFEDNLGSCYENALTALDGAIAAHVTGIGCPNDRNAVRWFAHPDGSADSLGWADSH